MDISLIRASFDKARPIGDDVVKKLYEILLMNYPQASPLFANIDMVRQQQVLWKSLTFIVDNIENLDRLTPYLKKLGERHIKYGAQEEHYQWVGESLLETFKHFLGEEWTIDLHNNWVDAFNLISETMLAGAAAAPADDSIAKVVPIDTAQRQDETAASESIAAGREHVVMQAAGQVKFSDEIQGEIRAAAKDLVADEVKRIFDEAVQAEINEFKLSVREYVNRRLA